MMQTDDKWFPVNPFARVLGCIESGAEISEPLMVGLRCAVARMLIGDATSDEMASLDFLYRRMCALCHYAQSDANSLPNAYDVGAVMATCDLYEQVFREVRERERLEEEVRPMAMEYRGVLEMVRADPLTPTADIAEAFGWTVERTARILGSLKCNGLTYPYRHYRDGEVRYRITELGKRLLDEVGE